MIDSGISPQSMDTQAKQAELVQFKVRMDGLKKRLAGAPDEEKELRKACRDFEAVFVGKLWEQMQKTVPKEGYLHSKQEQQYLSMFNREFSEHLTEAGGIGLADMLYEQLARQLKQTSAETLASGTDIKPLAENAKPAIKTLGEAEPSVAPLRGPEPETPHDIEPVAVGGARSDGADEADSANDVARTTRDVASMSAAEVRMELDTLARELRGAMARTDDPGSVFDTARKGPYLDDENQADAAGRKLAEI